MKTQCTQKSFAFHALANRDVVARFDGGRITSDAGGLLLREVERKLGILRQLAACFDDHRDPDLIEHSVPELIRQRVYALALGYEDLNDHDELRHDPLLAVLAGKADPTGMDRQLARDRGKACAGKSTLNRLELTPVGATTASRYKKIVAHQEAIERLFVDAFLQSQHRAPRQIVLDLDATDDPVHGRQLGRFFHGYYGHYCYLPLYIFAGDHLLCAKLRPSDIDAPSGSVQELERIVGQIRRRWPRVRIVVRADSGFCRENIMAWCERNRVDYVLGLAKNERLVAEIDPELYEAREYLEATGQPARVFRDFEYRTLDSWSRSRRVIGKAEQLPAGPNPRFIVTSLKKSEVDGRSLYEDVYCAGRHGESHQRAAARVVCRSHQRRDDACQSIAAVAVERGVRAHVRLAPIGSGGHGLGRAQCETIRLKLLKIGARVHVTVRKVWLSLSEAYPYQALFAAVYHNLRSVRAGPAG